MLNKLKILETFKNSDLYNRFFKVQIFSKQNTNVVQFNSGGDDYNPPANCEGLGGIIGNNPNNGYILAWRDEIERTAEPGEKRLYAVNGDNKVACEIHLKNDGSVVISGGADITIKSSAKVNITATAANITADEVNLGGSGGGLVLTENSTILDSSGGSCIITPNTSITKAV